MKCRKIVDITCSRNHKRMVQCSKQISQCFKCKEEDDKKEADRQRDHKLEQERDEKQKEYARRLAELKDEIEHRRRILREQNALEAQENVLRQHQEDLRNLDKMIRRAESSSSGAPAVPNEPPKSSPESGDTQEPSTPTPDEGKETDSPTRDTRTSSGTEDAAAEWKHQKELEGAENEALDSLMDMIGLEAVKEKFLTIKSKVDVLVRQNIDTTTERFGAALLGNPGTGTLSDILRYP